MKISWNKKGWRILHTHPVNTDKYMEITGAGNTIDGRLALLKPLDLKKYVRDLKPNTKPKYTLLRGLFLNKLENNIELGLDWTNQLTKNKLKKRR